MTNSRTPAEATSKQHAKVVSVLVSVGSEDQDRSIEDLEAAIRASLRKGAVRAKNVTVTQSYYIVGGKVCLPGDYDPERRDFKPGATPPGWAGGPTKQSPQAATPAVPDEEPRSFVHVEPTRSSERGPTGRRIRSDRGVPRPARRKSADTIDASNERLVNG